MLFQGFGPNGDVVDVYVTNVANPRPEGSCDATLVDGRGILYSHWHHHPFVQSPWCVYRCEVNVVVMHACLEKTVGHIDRGKVCSTGNICEDVLDKRDWETVRDRVRVKLSIIVHPTWEDGWVSFWNNESARSCSS